MGNTPGMVTVYESINDEDLASVETLLEELGIRFTVQNRALFSTWTSAKMFATPFIEVAAGDASAARAAVESMLRTRRAALADPDAEQPCSSCGEVSPAGFELCWSCSAPLGGGAPDEES